MYGRSCDQGPERGGPDIEAEARAVVAGAGPTHELRLEDLTAGELPRSAGIQHDHVRTLAEVHEALPPILVNRRTGHVVDGIHRVHAARSRGAQRIAVLFCDLPAEDEFTLAVACNSAHGLGLSLTDRRRAARRIMSVHSRWSDRRIARITGLSPTTVGTIRRHGHAGDEAPVRVGDDGRSRPIDAGRRREHAAEVLRNDPSLSLRKVSALCGISPSTALNVRKSLVSEGRRPTIRSVPRHLDRVPRRTPAPASPEDVLAALRTDPSIRFSQAGRLVVRLLEINLSSDEKYEHLSLALPDHCLERVGQVARAVASRWTRFANALDARRSAAGARAEVSPTAE